MYIYAMPCPRASNSMQYTVCEQCEDYFLSHHFLKCSQNTLQGQNASHNAIHNVHNAVRAGTEMIRSTLNRILIQVSDWQEVEVKVGDSTS